jgi:hypothetical protein
MFTIQVDDGAPTLAEAAQIMQIQECDLDRGFGVVAVDPKRGIYTVLLRPEAPREPSTNSPQVEGPFSNPGIGHFGPPR